MENRVRIGNDALREYLKYLNDKDSCRVLVIGDLHEPFSLDSYFDHVRKVRDRYQCNRVVFMGDVIDSHHTSYHETDPDGMGGGDELDLAIRRLERWHTEFGPAEVMIGNHDRIVSRKAFSAGIPKKWIREYHEVLETPNWEFKEKTIIGDTLYHHGEGGTARTRYKKELMSTWQGHLHSQFYIDYMVGQRFKIYGVQSGCGIDHEKYAFAYGKNFPKPIIGCGVDLDGTPHLEPMHL
jgi:predicted phosphodiesterase